MADREQVMALFRFHMGTDCSGYIEILSLAFTPGEEDAIWSGVVNVGPLVDRHYLLFCRLFGVRCEDVRRYCNENPVPLAPQRGLPPNVSEESKRYLQYMDDVSWASLEELEAAFTGLTFDQYDWGWRFILDNMRFLVGKLGSEHVRLVLGFGY